MKITLAEISYWHGRKLASHSLVDPLAISYIGGYVKKAGHDVELLFQQRGETIDEITQKILNINPDIVGFSCYTYKIPSVLKIAGEIKKTNPKIKTVLGGYHLTAIPETVLYDAIDFGVIGEGEQTFTELLNCLEQEKDFHNIESLVHKKSDFRNIKRRKRLDFAELPWPLRKNEFFKDTGVRGITHNPLGQYKMAQIQYSRGCPYDCSYCCSPELWQRTVKWRNPKDVVNEMEYLKKNFGIDFFFFSDLTFNASTRKVFELTDLLKKEKFEWMAMPSIDVGNMDKELITEMKEAGCVRLMYGIESLDETIAIQDYKRKGFKDLRRLDALYNTFRLEDELGIINRGFLIFGDLREKPEDIKKYLKMLKKLLPDEIRIGILTPLPGSALYLELKDKILYKNFPKDWVRFSTNELIFKHPNFTNQGLIKLSEWLFDSYYESKEYGKHVEKKIKNHPYLREGFEDFFKWLRTKRVNVSM